MNERRYKWILYAIVFVILGTIAIQVYWNYKNYQSNKQQFINEVQLSLDNAVELYFANIAEESTMAYALEGNSADSLITDKRKIDSVFSRVKLSSEVFNSLDTSHTEVDEDISLIKGTDADTLVRIIYKNHDRLNWRTKHISVEQNTHVDLDSLPNSLDFKMLTSKVIISMTSDSLQLNKIDTLLQSDLSRKNLDITYGLTYYTPYGETLILNKNMVESASLISSSKSTYLPRESHLQIHFSNETKAILKRILSGILLSTLLILAVIGCLFYLLKIIKHQKKLAEVKNDLISNITHEFKTPIATIGVALESIKNFNVIEDKAKTQTYLDMSNDQLSKLNLMVEKLLETATLDSDSLTLHKEKTNISDLVATIVSKHQLQAVSKTMTVELPQESLTAKVDIFHLDNAINNILDNAIKYGGDTISVNLKQGKIAFSLIISDNGQSLSKDNKDKIFEKFYRVPKGNTHDVKGFGIGLYYAKKIIEKHGGAIHLDLSNELTTFKISVPYV